jgi:hypothetical protein
MAGNPCLKLYEIMKKRGVDQISDPDGMPARSELEQRRGRVHLFETVAGTTKLTI